VLAGVHTPGNGSTPDSGGGPAPSPEQAARPLPLPAAAAAPEAGAGVRGGEPQPPAPAPQPDAPPQARRPSRAPGGRLHDGWLWWGYALPGVRRGQSGPRAHSKATPTTFSLGVGMWVTLGVGGLKQTRTEGLRLAPRRPGRVTSCPGRKRPGLKPLALLQAAPSERGGWQPHQLQAQRSLPAHEAPREAPPPAQPGRRPEAAPQPTAGPAAAPQQPGWLAEQQHAQAARATAAHVRDRAPQGADPQPLQPQPQPPPQPQPQPQPGQAWSDDGRQGPGAGAPQLPAAADPRDAGAAAAAAAGRAPAAAAAPGAGGGGGSGEWEYLDPQGVVQVPPRLRMWLLCV